MGETYLHLGDDHPEFRISLGDQALRKRASVKSDSDRLEGSEPERSHKANFDREAILGLRPLRSTESSSEIRDVFMYKDSEGR